MNVLGQNYFLKEGQTKTICTQYIPKGSYIYIKRTAKYIFNFTYGNNIINNETNDVK